jgi:hypothetical protein
MDTELVAEMAVPKGLRKGIPVVTGWRRHISMVTHRRNREKG